MLNNEIIKFECVECFEDVEIIVSNELLQLDPVVKEIIKNENMCLSCFYDNYFKCWNCGEYHNYNDISMEEIKIFDGGIETYVPICGDCIDNNPDSFYVCEGCGEWLYAPDFPYEEVKEMRYNTIEYYCESCAGDNENIFYCVYHDRLEYSIDRIYVYNQGDICWDAYEDNYSTCDNCGDVYEYDDIIFTEGGTYCNECYESHEAEHGKIRSYHDHKIEHIRENKILSSENSITLGVELEVESSGFTECGEMSNILYDNSNDFFVYESDSSLNNGFEIITRPYDLEYYKKEGKQIFINALELLQNNKFRSHDGGRCGLHVHIGRHGLGNSYQERINTIRKINIITEYFSPELTILSRRAAEKLNHWAKFGTYGIDRENLTIEKLDEIHENNRGRYSALNLNNESTIEFRFFRGTLKKESFLSAIELIYNICSWCIDNEIKELEKLDFYEISTYKLNEYIGDYLASKGIEKKEVVLI